MRIFFSVDVHGSTLVWRKWVRAYDVYRVDTLVLAGDLTGKVLVPIIKQSDGVWTATYFGRRWVLKSEGVLRGYIVEVLDGVLRNYWRVEG
jgi:Icc-related predicted phosphoesterase